MIDTNNLSSLIGANVVDTDDRKVGTVGQVYVDSATGNPTWVTVNTGLFGTSQSFAPLDDAEWDQERLRVRFEKDFIKDAPRIDDDGALSEEDESALYEYYGKTSPSYSGDHRDDSTVGGTARERNTTDLDDADLSASDLDAVNLDASDRDATNLDASDRDATNRDATYVPTTDAAPARDRDTIEEDTIERDTTADRTARDGYDTSGPTTDDAMTRSEERLNVGTERVVTGRARLRKYVVTENQSVTVPVSHEEVRLEREPITDANRGDALSGPDISEEEHEVVLTEERPVVSKETVPVERVSLNTETVTDEERVTEDVRREEVELIDPQDTDSREDSTSRTR